ncbi:MAG: AraC family transcriptional regulator [Bacteroidota bacterium]
MISLVLFGGNLEHRTNNQIERKSGNLNFYHAFEIHKNEYQVFPSIHINLEVEPDFLQEHHLSEGVVHRAVTNSVDSRFTFLKLLKEATIDDAHSKISLEMSFLSFLEPSGTNLNANHPVWVTKIRDFLNDKWNEPITLKELSEYVNVHPVNISKYFARYFGCTLGAYMRKLKIKGSFSLLESSNYSLTEIAHCCGFADQSHFTRVFKSITGHLPKEVAKL